VEKGNTTNDTIKFQRITRDCIEKQYAKRFEILEEMDRFLYTYVPPKLNQDQLDVFTAEFYHTF
jgi:hypothetical protein